MKMKNIAALSLAFFSVIFYQTHATVMLGPGTTLPGQAYIEYGGAFSESMVAVRIFSTTTGNYSYISGVQIDERHVLTAAHVVDSSAGFRPLENLSIVIGANFNAPDHIVGVRRYAVDPTYRQGSFLGTGSEVDLAIIELASPIAGRGVTIANIPPNNGDVLSFSGYGRYAIAGGQEQVQDGHLRAFLSISTSPSGLFDNQIYMSGIVSTPFALSGIGANFDSGGGIYFNGELTGIMTAGSGGTSGGGITTGVDLTNPERQEWISKFKSCSVTGFKGFHLSEPVIIAASASNGPRVGGRINGGAGGKQVRIEVSRDLGLADSWFTLGMVTLDKSGAGEFTSVPDDRPASIATPTYFLRIAASP